MLVRVFGWGQLDRMTATVNAEIDMVVSHFLFVVTFLGCGVLGCIHFIPSSGSNERWPMSNIFEVRGRGMTNIHIVI